MIFWVAVLIITTLSFWSLSRVGSSSSWVTNYLLLLVGCLTCFVVAEFCFRARHFFVRGIPFLTSLEQYHEKVFGWEGQKLFPKEALGKRIFVVGDSFTEGLGVKPQQLYHQVLGQELGAAVYSYAGLGYGTLQEFLVLDRYLAEIRPDLIVLQVCSNDFLNNDLELETRSYRQNALMPRPYLIRGKIEYHFPSRLGKFRLFLSRHSRAIHFLFVKADLALARLARDGNLIEVEDEIKAQGKKLQAFARAVSTTDEIVGKIKQRVGDTPIIIFMADDLQPATAEFAAIFAKYKLPFIRSIPQALWESEKQGKTTRLEDRVHWNEQGHESVGILLAKELQKMERES